MPSASRIKFGDYLDVTDEGAGVIRVDGCPPGGAGGGIQFDTYPQVGGTLAVQTQGPSLIDLPGTGQTSLYIADDNGGGGVFIESKVGGGVQIRTDGGPVDPGTGGIQFGATSGGITLSTASFFTSALGCVFTLSMDGVADLYSQNSFTIDSDLEFTIDAPRLFIPGLPTTDPGVSHPNQIWADSGVLVLRGSTVGGSVGTAGGIRFGVANSGSTLDIATTGSETHKLNSSTGQRLSVQDHAGDSLMDIFEDGHFEFTMGSTQFFRVIEQGGNQLLDVEEQSGVFIGLIGSEAFQVFGNPFQIMGITADSDISFRIDAGKTVTVYDSSNSPIFQINEDGSLQGKTGKALTFNL